MLVCPQCQFENPNNNKFCQKCGTSLTHKNCHECDTLVALDAENCPNCGAFTGTVWWAIVAEQEIDNALDTAQAASATPESDATAVPNQDVPVENQPIEVSLKGQYLDPGRRYRIVAIEAANSLTSAQFPSSRLIFQGKVVDCQPLQKSVLEVLLEQKTDLMEAEAAIEAESESLLWQQISIPEPALSYLSLQEFSPLVPEIHDAWLEGSKEVILLSDRSQWQLLSERWAQQPLPTWQIAEQLNEMLTLWKALAPVHCCQSLLLETNLRVNEDDTFGLQQLYHDPTTEPTLKDLAQLWQHLLQKSGQETSAEIRQLLAQVAQGEIDSLAQLRLQLQELADDAPEEIESTPQATSNPNPVSSSQADTQLSPVTQNPTPKAAALLTESSEGDDLSTALLPMQLYNLADAGYTDIGRQRPHNEDYFGIRTRQAKKQQSNHGHKLQARGLYIVCDGMGGHAAGEVASAMATETLQRYFKSHWRDRLPDRETIQQGVLLANQTIYQVNQQNASSGSGRMGTTLVMALVQNTKVAIAHVGDSRIYRVNRKWGLEQLTVDHEVGQRAIQDGIDPQIAYARPDAYQLTQALGPHDNHSIKPDIQFLDLHEDTLLLLCSDGLSDNDLIEKHWQTYLSPLISSSADLDKGLQKLIDFANQHNGHDNITGILVRVKVRPYMEG